MYRYVTSRDELINSGFMVDFTSVDEVYFDTETTGLDFFADKIVLMQVKLGDNTYIFDTRKLGENLSKYVVQLIKDSDKQVTCFNSDFDVRMVHTNYGELITNNYDTLLAEIMITNGTVKGKERFFTYADLVKKYCAVDISKEVRLEFTDPNLVIEERHLIYASLDVQYLPEIKAKQLQKLEEQKQMRTLELENALIAVIASMENEGVLLNTEIWNHLSGIAGDLAEPLREQLVNEFIDKVLVDKKFDSCLDYADFLKLQVKTKRDRNAVAQITDPAFIRDYLIQHFNINSSDQMLIMLRDVYGVPVESTNEKIIDKYIYSHPIIRRLIDYREQAKKISGFGDNITKHIHPATGRIHTRFRQLGAQSGRIASAEPNLQNIPRESEYRSAFVARKGKKMISADFSQEELRLLAVVAKVERMIEAFRNGIDLHLATASGLFKIELDKIDKEQRRKGKTLNFAVGYGSTEYGLYKNFGIPMDEGKDLLKVFYGELYPEIDQSKTLVQKHILKHGYSTTLIGRKRFFEIPSFFPGGFREREKFIASIVREGFNHIIQGTGADIIKKALVRIFYENPFGNGLKILIQVYDEIVCEVDEDIAEKAQEFIVRIMTECEQEFLKGVVPAVVDASYGDCWIH